MKTVHLNGYKHKFVAPKSQLEGVVILRRAAQDTSNRTHINRFSATGIKNDSFAAGVRRSGNTQIAMFQVIVS